MKQILACAAVIVLAAAAVEAQDTAATFNYEVQSRVPLEAKTLKGAPYSAEVVTDHTQSLPDGNRIVEHSTGRVFRDSEGRVRREQDRASGNASISIFDPVAGVSYALDPERRIAWKTPAQAGFAIMGKLDAARAEMAVKGRRGGAPPDGPIEGGVIEMRQREDGPRGRGGETIALEATGGFVTLRRFPAGGEQHKEEALAARVMEGVRVEGVRTTRTIAAGAIGNEWPITSVSEEWTSPDLQILVLTDRKDPRNGDSSYRLQHIVRGEPSSSLFQVPPDYEIKDTGVRRFEQQH